MAQFQIAYNLVKDFEGGYSNDAGDRGGETYAGIARNFFPNWKGWSIVDKVKRETPSISKTLAKNSEIQKYVSEWYKIEWWDKLKLDNFPQDLANEIFEQSVNLGKGGHGKLLQQMINAFNYNKSKGTRIFEDLVVDGAVGPKTLNALSIIVNNRSNEKSLVHALNCLQGRHYINLAANNLSQRKFLDGWMTRTYD